MTNVPRSELGNQTVGEAPNVVCIVVITPRHAPFAQ